MIRWLGGGQTINVEKMRTNVYGGSDTDSVGTELVEGNVLVKQASNRTFALTGREGGTK